MRELDGLFLHLLIFFLQPLARRLPEVNVLLHLDFDLFKLLSPGIVFAEHVLHLLDLLVFLGELCLKVSSG